MIETERLRIYPATQNQMEIFIKTQTDEILKAAYTEMLENCLKFPDKWEWYAAWFIELNNGTHIGEMCFKGLNSNGVAEIGYGISEEYRRQGYATEAVNAVTAWAFQNPNVTAIEAETDAENVASKRVLEKCGFIANGKIGEEGPRFTLTR
ncbi:MAG: GNAT family N-acetyltransferase [Treponema sp.]|uniref:GNAT family N-acetyltransferase n=1 Tax=Treponema sp. TaxID=166 RepID=UPI0025FB6EED|nr:GNAT family N-acetyltransferase [Treponema sp.]MBQ8680631.1 GNAT family N-acetyltransferase [Treponema sp.]